MSFIYPCLLWWAWVGVLSRKLEEFCLNSALSKFPPNPSPSVFPVTVHPFVGSEWRCVCRMPFLQSVLCSLGANGLEVNRINFLLLHDALPQSWWLQQCTHIISQFLWIRSLGTTSVGPLLKVSPGWYLSVDWDCDLIWNSRSLPRSLTIGRIQLIKVGGLKSSPPGGYLQFLAICPPPTCQFVLWKTPENHLSLQFANKIE